MQRTRDGSTPAHTAAEYGHAECLDALIRAGADPSARTKAGSSVADVAAGEGACLEVLHRAAAALDEDQAIESVSEKRQLLVRGHNDSNV
jgi:hypothetical protein